MKAASEFQRVQSAARNVNTAGGEGCRMRCSKKWKKLIRRILWIWTHGPKAYLYLLDVRS